MIEDLISIEGGARIDADICLIGAGAAGISIAQALVGSGLRVCLLESGGFQDEPETQSLYQAEAVGHPMSVTEGRYRLFGGSTTRWTGRCGMLAPIDIEPRPWLPDSGWPITLESLTPYYDQAQAVVGFAEPWTPDHEAPADAGVDLPAFDADYVEPFVWRYAPQGNRVYRDWGKHFRATLERARDVRVLLHANCVGINPDERGDRVQSVTARALNGNTAEIRAGAFVLCAGGIENARQLLASPLGRPGAAGNRYDQIGRYFMQHPRGQTARLRTSEAAARRLQDLFNIFARRSGLQYEFGFALSEAAQRREGLLNCSAIFTYDADPLSGWESAKALLRDLRRFLVSPATMGQVGRALAGANEVARNAGRQFSGRHSILSTRAIHVLMDLEQAPDPDSRITLSDRVDALGMPLPRIDWRLSELERTTARYFTTQLGREFSRLGIGELEPAPWLFDAAPINEDQLAGTFHHIGATRMSADPRKGAVDADCRVHGIENLYVTGCSVFSTGGQINPTFTIVALALRLAEHLQAALAPGRIALMNAEKSVTPAA